MASAIIPAWCREVASYVLIGSRSALNVYIISRSAVIFDIIYSYLYESDHVKLYMLTCINKIAYMYIKGHVLP